MCAKNSLFVCLLILLVFPGQASILTQDTVSGKPAPPVPRFLPTENPSAWINESNNTLIGLFLSRTRPVIDTAEVLVPLREHLLTIRMLKELFSHHPASLSIRTVHSVKMRAADILADVRNIHRRIHDENEELTGMLSILTKIGAEIEGFRKAADSMFLITFEPSVRKLEIRQQESERVINQALLKTMDLEDNVIDISIQVYRFHREVSDMLQAKEAELVRAELPPVWRARPSDYPATIDQVLYTSFSQTMESLKYYGESSIWRIVIFRGLIVLLCLVPIRIFHNRSRKQRIVEETRLLFLADFPKTASVIMGMALAPVVFVHPPHAFMEAIMIGLTFTVTMLTLKNYHNINRTFLFTLITAFLILYLINFFVTPTFLGRLIYTASIFLLIPAMGMFRELHTYQLRHEKAVRWFLVLFALHLVAGWILVLSGTYTLGRSVILAGFGLLISTMILRVAIYTVLDYIEIIAYFINNGGALVRIHAAYLHRALKPYLMAAAAFLLAMAYLYTLNLLDLVKSGLGDFLLDTHSIGEARFQRISIVVFLASVFIAFQLATLLRYAFDPPHDQMTDRRSRLGSYMLLLRLLVICSGLIVGILASGLSLTHFSIFIGALGVGIGLGLQNIVSNLISGIIIAFERPFVVGDTVEFGGETGRVKEISLRATMIHTTPGADILIPNNTLLSNNLKNWTITNKHRLINVKVITAHSADAGRVQEILQNCIHLIETIDPKKSYVHFRKIDDTGLQFSAWLMIPDLNKQGMIRSQYLSLVYAEFEKNGVTYPVRKV